MSTRLEQCERCAPQATPNPTVTHCETCGEPIQPTPRIHQEQK